MCELVKTRFKFNMIYEYDFAKIKPLVSTFELLSYLKISTEAVLQETIIDWEGKFKLLLLLTR